MYLFLSVWLGGRCVALRDFINVQIHVTTHHDQNIELVHHYKDIPCATLL